jgi:hypothetical protein
VPGRTIDLVAVGPCPRDPYDPAASAWALAAGFAAGGDTVRVLHPAGPTGGDAPAGVIPMLIDVPLRRPGALVEGAALTLAAGRRIRPDADLVVRDPFGLGRLGLERRRGSGPAVVGVVHRLELLTYDAESARRSPSSVFDRVDTWRDRRAVRRLERGALDEARHLVYDSPELPEVLAREYGISAGRLRPVPPSVRDSGPAVSRDVARREMHLPLDVPVVVAPLSSEDPLLSGADRVREAFRRMRSLFAGARLVVVGGTAPSEPGVSSLPDRHASTFERAFAAGDVALVAPSAAGFDPGVILSLRAHCPVIVGPGVRFPLDPGGAVRTVASDDPAELAAALAELLADGGALRRPFPSGAGRRDGHRRRERCRVLGFRVDRFVEPPLAKPAAPGRPPHGARDSGPGQSRGDVPTLDRVQDDPEPGAQGSVRVLGPGGRPRTRGANDLDRRPLARPDPHGLGPRAPAPFGEAGRGAAGREDNRDPVPPGPPHERLREDRPRVRDLRLDQPNLVPATRDQVEVVGPVRVDPGSVPEPLEMAGGRFDHGPFRRPGPARHVPDRRNHRSIRLRGRRT